MLSFPNCKINLGLRITGRREDGFHELETIFYPLPFKDALEFIPLPGERVNRFNSTGIPLQVTDEQNLCLRAWKILKNDFPEIPCLDIHLHKIIPMGAGLGGGSSDAAFMLKMLNNRFSLNISPEKMQEYALHLGSDCPFFLLNQPCFAHGRGELLEPVDLDLSAYFIVLIFPNLSISTSWAFSQVKPIAERSNLKDIITSPITAWKDGLFNDFETVTDKSFPLIADCRKSLYKQGALYASLSGSGSTVFGIFDADPVKISVPDGCSFTTVRGSL